MAAQDFQLVPAKASLIYSKWPRVAQIKTNSGQLQFTLKRSLDEIQLTSDQTCLLEHGAEACPLISLHLRCTGWLSDINHPVIIRTTRRKAGSHGPMRNSPTYYQPPLMLLFPLRSGAQIWLTAHISAAVSVTDNIWVLWSCYNRVWKQSPCWYISITSAHHQAIM